VRRQSLHIQLDGVVTRTRFAARGAKEAIVIRGWLVVCDY